MKWLIMLTVAAVVSCTNSVQPVVSENTDPTIHYFEGSFGDSTVWIRQWTEDSTVIWSVCRVIPGITKQSIVQFRPQSVTYKVQPDTLIVGYGSATYVVDTGFILPGQHNYFYRDYELSIIF